MITCNKLDVNTITKERCVSIGKIPAEIIDFLKEKMPTLVLSNNEDVLFCYSTEESLLTIVRKGYTHYFENPVNFEGSWSIFGGPGSSASYSDNITLTFNKDEFNINLPYGYYAWNENKSLIKCFSCKTYTKRSLTILFIIFLINKHN